MKMSLLYLQVFWHAIFIKLYLSGMLLYWYQIKAIKSKRYILYILHSISINKAMKNLKPEFEGMSPNPIESC